MEALSARKQTRLRKNAGALTPRKLSPADTRVHTNFRRQLAQIHTHTLSQNINAPAHTEKAHRSFSSASNAATAAPRSRNNRRTRGLHVLRLPEHATTLHDAPASALK